MTILGSHTQLEVKQLIAAMQSHADDVQKAFDVASDTWDAADTNARQAWVQDWNAWKTNWAEALGKELGLDAVAQSAISLVTLGPILGNLTDTSDVIPDEDGYQSILNAIYWPSARQDTVVPGNLNGLDQRLVTATGNFPRAVPPAQTATDFDLDFIQGTSGVTTAVDELADLPTKIAKVLPKPSTLGKWIAGALGIIIAGVATTWAVDGVESVKMVKRIKDKVIG